MLLVRLRILLLSCLILGACSATKVFPGVGDHWHTPYGFYICDRWVGGEVGIRETDKDGNPTNKVVGIYHVHGHDDGLMHWHPSTNAAGGTNATLGLYLSFYEIRIDDWQLDLPDYLGGPALEGITVCDTPKGQVDGELTVHVYEPGSTEPTIYTENLAGTLLNLDGRIVAVVFGPPGLNPGRPPYSDVAPQDQ